MIRSHRVVLWPPHRSFLCRSGQVGSTRPLKLFPQSIEIFMTFSSNNRRQFFGPEPGNTGAGQKLAGFG